MKLGAYLQVYKNDTKANCVLSYFRTFYPSSPIFLVSDKGDSFIDVAQEFNCRYLHDNFNTGSGCQGFTKEAALIWLQRMKHAFEYCATDFMLYMEDDVLVRKEIKINPSWKIAGLYANPIPSELAKSTYNTNMYGACGGTIYHTETFLRFYPDFVMRIEDDDAPFAFLDMFMPILYMQNRFEYSQSTELTEAKRNPAWKHSEHSIVHDHCWKVKL